MLTFNGKSYRTISDVSEVFKVSPKTVNKLISEGQLPEPERVYIGTRAFKHFTDDWMEQMNKFLFEKKTHGQ